MTDTERRGLTWWERIPPLLLIVLGMVIIGARISTQFDSEALMTMAGVLIGAGIVLEAIHHR